MLNVTYAIGIEGKLVTIGVDDWHNVPKSVIITQIKFSAVELSDRV